MTNSPPKKQSTMGASPLRRSIAAVEKEDKACQTNPIQALKKKVTKVLK